MLICEMNNMRNYFLGQSWHLLEKIIHDLCSLTQFL
jgi:hypothetical protein